MRFYSSDDDAQRSHGFMIFSTGINIGAMLGPLLCGLLAQVYGWHYGFGVAAVFMVLGLATYLYGYRYLPARVALSRRGATRLTTMDWRIIGSLSVVIVVSILPSIAFNQIFNVTPVWIDKHVLPTVGGVRIPVPWFISSCSLFTILAVPVLLWIWRRQGMRGDEPDEITKIGMGAIVVAASNLILVAAIVWSGGRDINPFWVLLYSVGLGIGFICYWPTLLALVSRAAPESVNATMMGIVFMSLFIGNNFIGWIGGFYERMGPLKFWLLHALISAAGGLFMMLFARILRRLLSQGAQG